MKDDLRTGLQALATSMDRPLPRDRLRERYDVAVQAARLALEAKRAQAAAANLPVPSAAPS